MCGAVIEDHRLAVGLDPEDQKRKSHQRHTKGEKQKCREHGRLRLFRRDQMAGTGDQRQTQRPDDLAKAVGGLAEARGARPEIDAVLSTV